MATGFLTSSYRWRKQKNRRPSSRDMLFDMAKDLQLQRSTSAPTLSSSSLEHDSHITVVRASTFGNFFSEQEAKKKSKRVSFKNVIEIVLIPTVSEIKSAKVDQYLWYDALAYAEFKRNALEEIMELIRKDLAHDVKSAMKVLSEFSYTNIQSHQHTAIESDLSLEVEYREGIIEGISDYREGIAVAG